MTSGNLYCFNECDAHWAVLMIFWCGILLCSLYHLKIHFCIGIVLFFNALLFFVMLSPELLVQLLRLENDSEWANSGTADEQQYTKMQMKIK